jgi:hypothetical protein
MENDILDPSSLVQKPLPNATATLVLGIVSIVTCLFYGVPGIACGIIAIVLHKKDKQLYLTSPAAYEASYKNSKAGQICGIIGLSLSVLFLIFLIIYFFFIFSLIGYGLTHSAGN